MSTQQTDNTEKVTEKFQAEEGRGVPDKEVQHGPAASLSEDDIPTEEEYKVLRK